MVIVLFEVDVNFPDVMKDIGCDEAAYCPYYPRSCSGCVKHFAKDYRT